MLSILWLVAGAGLWSFLLLPISVIVCVSYARATDDGSDAEREARYQRQWYCNTCGAKFETQPSSQESADPRANQRSGPTGGPDDGGGSREHDAADQRYAGPSPAYNRGQPEQRALYIERVLNPVQRAKSATERDLSGLAMIVARMGADTAFEPLAGVPIDLGVISRLASLNFIEFVRSADRFYVTPRGFEAAQTSRQSR